MALNSLWLPWFWLGCQLKIDVDIDVDMLRGFSYNISGHRGSADL